MAVDEKIREMLAQRRVPALWFHTVENAHSKSRLGGLPSLAEGVDWPVHPDTMLPLHFMAQVDLAALPATPLPGCPFNAALPRGGMLYFFFNYAEYWDEGFSDTDANGIPKQSRVIFAPDADADREAPGNLPMIGYTPGSLDCKRIRKEKLLPEQHLRAYAIDTFWGAIDQYANHECTLPFGEEAREARFQSIVNATGEAAPIYPSYEAVPYPRPSCYYFVGNTGLRNMFEGLQMFGAEFWDGGSRPNVRRALLAEFPLDGYIGSLQFWIERKDLKAQRFNHVYGETLFT
jgi:hypothetical protein